MLPGPRPTSVPSGTLTIQPFDHNRYGPKIGEGLCPFFFGGAGSPSNTKSPGPRPTSISSGILIHPAVWPERTWAENWGAVPLLGWSWCPSNTMWLGWRHTCTRSFIFIRPTVWPQYTNVTDRTDNSRIA